MTLGTFQTNRARRAVRVLGVTFCLSLISSALFAQGNFGRILGTVTDQTGAVIAGAAVTVLDTERGLTRNLLTDDAGEYNAPNLIPGTYTVRVEMKGFKRLDRPNIALEVGKEVRVDLTPQLTGELEVARRFTRNPSGTNTTPESAEAIFIRLVGRY